MQADDQGDIEDCNAALAIRKSNDTYFQRALSKYQLKDYPGAIEDYTESLKLKPDYKSAILNRGIAYYMLEKDALAMTDLNRAIELDPKSDKAFYFRGKLKKYMKDLAGSCADLKIAKSLGYEKAGEELAKNGCQ